MFIPSIAAKRARLHMVGCTLQCIRMHGPYNDADDFTIFTGREIMADADKDKQHKPTGKVRHDPGGRAVWQWAIDSGKHAIESTSRLLQKLDLTSLQFLDYDEVKKQEQQDAARTENPERPIPTFGGEREQDPLASKQRGFDPYNTRVPMGRGALPNKPKAPPKPRITQPVRPAKKPGLFARLFGAGKG
jgi:hypothetical protein